MQVVNMILKVYDDSTLNHASEVPITPETTCSDVIECFRHAGLPHCHLVELWRGCERPIGEDERPLEILKEWGAHRQEVVFFMRAGQPSPGLRPEQPDQEQQQHGPLGGGSSEWRTRGRQAGDMMPSGVDLTLAELQEMAARQQQQIEAQQQMLVAKEQRLKFLKQQELRHQQIAGENERLRQLREKVEAQELKLKKLRALRGEANEQKAKNTSLTAELESIKSLFNEKEKELSMAVAKVDDMSKQLEELRKGRLNGLNGTSSTQTSNMVELEKLRKELTLRNKVNEQQNAKLAAHKEILQQRRDEMAGMDSRIAELQSRLRKKQLEQKQQSGRLAEGRKGSNVAAVEPYIQRMPHSREDSTLSDIVKPNNDKFQKQDPKYQTLPYNIKFPDLDDKQEVPAQDGTRGKGDGGEAGKVPEVKPTAASSRMMSHFAPKPYGGYRTATPTSNQPPKDEVDSPSLLYSGSPRANTPPKTSTPVGPARYGNKMKEIFITGAPTQSSMSPPRVAAGASRVSPAPSPAGSQDKHGSYSQPPSQPRQTTQQQSPAAQPPPQQSQLRSGSQQPQSKPSIQQSQPRVPAQPQRPAVNPSHSNPHSSARERTIPPDSVSIPPRGSSSSDETRSPTMPPTQQQQQQQQQYPPARRQPESSGKAPENASSRLPSTPVTAQGPGSDPSLDTSPPAISSALSVLMAPPTTTSASKPSYRYAPKSVIANTYMSQMGSKSLEQYQQHKHASLSEQQRPLGSPTAKVQPMPSEHSGKPATRGPSPGKAGPSSHPPHYHHHYRRPHSPPADTQNEQHSNGPPPYPGVPPYKIDPHYRPNAPRPLRRRWSITEMDEHPKHGLARSQPPPNDTKSSKPETAPPDVIRVDQAIQEDKSTAQPKDDVPFIDDSTAKETPPPAKGTPAPIVIRRKTNMKKNKDFQKSSRRVSFDPLALLLDASLEGELELVKTTARQVKDPSASNDEGITALHNAICAGHYEIVRFLVEYGCDVNSPDSDGWTPLHCAASCNNLPMVKFLVEHGACIFATTISDQETAAEKCEEDEDGFDGCSEYLYSVQEKLGILHQGSVYAVFDYEAENADELAFKNRDQLIVLRKGDEHEAEWWWAHKAGAKGYIPRNLLGLYPRVIPEWLRKDSPPEKK